MLSQLQLFQNQCTPTEQFIIQPLKIIQISESLFEYKRIGDTIFLYFNRKNDSNYCPFEICFSRDDSVSFFSFFIGVGAEVSCFEKIGSSDDYLIRQDLINFLCSRIHAELYYDIHNKVIKAVYYPDVMLQESPMRAYGYRTRTGYIWPWIKYNLKTIDYIPLCMIASDAKTRPQSNGSQSKEPPQEEGK